MNPDTPFDYSQLAVSPNEGSGFRQAAYYTTAADNHNYGNGNFAVTDPSTWVDSAVDKVANMSKFVTASVISGADSFYNTGVTVANWLGADAEAIDVSKQMASIDDDLGKYYTENKQSVDMAGFVLGSLIPGTLGIKVLNAGQKALRIAQSTGYIGANLSRATGLLAPGVEAYTKLAAADIATSSATFSLMSGNALKAVAAGYGQAALESAAFEIAVSATMFKSPVLDDMDASDIAKNIALGTAVGGVIGGAISHAMVGGSVKNAVKKFSAAERPYADVTDLTGLSPAQSIIARQQTLEALPKAPTTADVLGGDVQGVSHLLDGLPSSEQSMIADNIASKLTRMRAETETSLNLKNRTSIQELAGGDATLANHIADTLAGSNADQAFNNFEKLTEVGRISSKLSADKDNAVFLAKLKKETPDIETMKPEDFTAPFKVGYVKLTGEGAGTVSFEAPAVTNIADSISPSKIFSDAQQISKVVDKYGFKAGTTWDASAVKDHIEAEARYLWVDKAVASGKIEMKDGMNIGENDIPLLEKAIDAKLTKINVISKDGNYEVSGAGDVYSENNLYKHVMLAKESVAKDLLQGAKSGTGLTTPEIAKIVNVRQSFLDGEIDTAAPYKDYFARQSNKAEYVKSLKDKNLWTQEKENNYYNLPSYSKASYDTTELKDIDGNVLNGMAYLKAQQKLYQQGIDLVAAKYLPPETVDRFYSPGDSTLLSANRYGAGPGIFSFANGEYGSLASWAEHIGKATADTAKKIKDATTDRMQSAVYTLASNQEAAIEAESINKILQSTSELYGISADGTAAVPLKLLDYKAELAAGNKKAIPPTLQEGAPEIIPFKTPGARDVWVKRTQLTSDRTQGLQELRNAQGLEDMKDIRAMRPIRPDPKDYPYYAVVVDPTITGVGQKSMLHAASPKELEAMITKVPNKYEVYKGDQLKEYFKAHGEFDYERTLHENYIDGDLKSKGINNPFFARTDPQKIATSFLQDHLRSDDIFTRELVNAKFEKEFSFLRQQGEQYTNTATSKYTGSFRQIENTVDNPYVNYVKTALNLSQVSEHPLIQGFNTALDAQYSKAMNLIRDTFSGAKSPAELDNVNALLEKYGVSSGYRDAATDTLANHTAPKGDLIKFVGRANSILSTLVTRLDPLNAINNVVGSSVLYGSETKSFLNAMQGVNPEVASELGGLIRTPVPGQAALAGQSKDTVMTAGKLLVNAIKNFTDPEAKNLAGEGLKDFYMRNGWTTRLTDQFHQVLDNIALTGTEDVGTLSSKLNSAFAAAKGLAEKGEKYTGNKLAEEFNRFVSADTMRQMTDVGVLARKISPQEQLAYINSFVNRTQGNMLASQRPLMFQGAVGQAIGLFQTFQFNTMQQLFRHVAEGSKKDAAMLLGLQGTMYGMNGLPAFNFLNTHIVGTMSGNSQHQDLYTSTYGVAGKTIGDMLLYGIPSNMLRGNLYSRGDINPRTLTVVPTNPLDIPFVNATIRMYDNVKGIAEKSGDGGSLWQSLLQGVEHNGLSRPLAGISQTLQAATHGGEVFSTTSKGSISGGNDLMSWATAVRLAGGKPFDEAVANDALFRMTAYQASDRSKMDTLMGAVKSTVIGGGDIDGEQAAVFSQKYAAIGGKQSQFNKFMLKQIKNANTPQANQIMDALRNPYSQKMQEIMGGTELFDMSGVNSSQ